MLQIDGVTILLQVINFLVLLYLLSRFLYKPLRARLAERATKVESMMDNAAKLEAESYALKMKLERQLDEVDREALIAQAEAQGRQQAEDILHSAQNKADRLIARARQEAELERLEALKANYEQTLDTIMDLASGILRAVTIRQTHDNLVNNLAAYVWQRPPEEVEEYRRILAEGELTAFVYTPVPLTENQTKIIGDTLSSLADRHVKLDVRPDPFLIAGLRVHIGDRILDNSLRQQLDLLRDKVGQELRQRIGVAG